MTVLYKDYKEDKKAFFEAHHNDFKVYTSSIDSAGIYYKTYTFTDGATWYEMMLPTIEKATVEIKKVSVEVEVKMLRTEYWSTDNSESKFYYEKF